MIPQQIPGSQMICMCTPVGTLRIQAPQLLRQLCPAQKLWIAPNLLHDRLIAEGLVEVGQTVRAIGIVVTAKANREPLSSKRLLLWSPVLDARLLMSR